MRSCTVLCSAWGANRVFVPHTHAVCAPLCPSLSAPLVVRPLLWYHSGRNLYLARASIVARLVGCSTADPEVTGSIPDQGTLLVHSPGQGVCERQPITVSPPLFIPNIPSL